MAHSLNLANAVSATFPALHATGAADLTACSEAQMYRHISDAARELCSRTKLLVTMPALAATPGTPEYPLSSVRPVAVLAVWHGTKLLWATPVEELEALDGAWPDATGTAPDRTAGNARGTMLLRVYPKKVTGDWALTALIASTPADVTSGDATRALPAWLAPYFTLAAIDGAARTEGEERMPEQSGFSGEIRNLWETALTALYGEV